MSDIKFKFSNEKQRELNIGKEIDPTEEARRKVGKHSRSLKVWINNIEFRQIMDNKPQGVLVQVYPVLDANRQIIPPSEPEWWTTKPLSMVLLVSENHPLPWCQYNEYDLDEIITELFDGYNITEENLSEKEYPEVNTKFFSHTTVLENNTAIGQDNVNKFAFNVEARPIRESDIDYINEKYALYGYKIKKKDALMTNQNTKTINNERKFTFEVGDY